MSKNPYRGPSLKEVLKQEIKDPKFKKAFEEMKTHLRVCEKMKTAAEKADLGPREIARRMNTSPAQVVRLFSDSKANFRMDTIIRFAAALGKKVSLEFR